MQRRKSFWLKVLLVSGFLLVHSPAHAGPAAQEGPVEQCAQGIQLYLDGRAAEAAPLLEAGFAGRNTAEFADPDDLGACALVLGSLNMGPPTEVLEAFVVALGVFQATGNRLLEGTTLNNIGEVYVGQGRYDKALEVYEQALTILRKVGDRAMEGRTLNGFGAVYRSQGRYAEALETLQQALEIGREIGDRAGEGTTLSNIGLVYDSQGRYDEALKAYEQALAILQALGDRASEGMILNNIGAVYFGQERYDEAVETYEQALEIVREVGDRAGEGTTLVNIGEAAETGGLYDEALRAYDQALAVLREVGDRPGEGTTLSNIGFVYDSQGRYDEALKAYQQALAILQAVSDRAGEGTTLVNIGAAYQNQGHYEEALKAYEPAMDALESVRSIAGSEAGRSSFIAQYAVVYDGAVDLYHQQGQDDKAFLTSERGRARAFLDGLATGSVELSDDASADLLAHEHETYAARQAARDALAKARALTPADPVLVADLEAQLAGAEQEHQAALDAITARGGQLAALVPGRSGVLDLAAVQALLDDETTLVSYWVLGDKGALAFVVHADSFTTVELPDATSANLASAVDNTLSWLNREQAHPKPLRDLYTWLVAPLAEQLQTPQVVIVPHQQLQYVPFAALDDGQTYFGQQHLLSVIPSASALPFIQQNAAESAAKANTQALVFGNPTTGDPNYPSLVHAASEAQAVASLLGTAAVTNAEASETRLRDEAADSKVIHLAAHGGYNVANPLYSAIYLAPGGEGTAGDGRLETHEVYGLDLKGNELVVLSACQTNVGELSAGDELVGMTRAFFFAGTPTILSSLWSVDDAATETLMTAFYRHWQAGMGKAEALQAAQAEVRGKPNWASPFYWTGFVLDGYPGKIGRSPAAQPVSQPTGVAGPSTPASQSSGGTPCGMGAGMLVVGLAVVVRRRRS